MNRKINYCPSCGEKDQKEGARFCWYCGEALPKIETPSTPSQLLESEINPTRGNIPIDENPKKDFVSDLESKDHDYKELPKTEIPPVSRDLQKLENNSASKDSDVKPDSIVNTKAKSQKQPASNTSSYIALVVTIIILGFCVLGIFDSYLAGTNDFMIPFIITLVIILMVLAMIIMDIKQNRPESPKTKIHPATSPLLGSTGNPASNDNSGTKRQKSSKEKYQRYKNMLYAILFFYAVCVLQIFGSYFAGALDHVITSFIVLIVLSIIVGLILIAMKKNKPA